MRHIKTAAAAPDNGKRVLLSNQRVSLTGVKNAREPGGYENTDNKRVKEGKLIRSASLCPATPEDKRLLAELYRVGTVIDFRTPREAAEKPDPAFGAKYFDLPVLDGSDETGTPGLYLKMLFSDRAKKAYKRFFELLLASDDKQAVLFHSERGNDRTGVAAALLLTVLGVPENIIAEDYLLSNKVYGRDEYPEQTYMEPAPVVYAHSLDHAFTTAKVEYGSVINYIYREIGLNNKDIGELKGKYLF